MSRRLIALAAVLASTIVAHAQEPPAEPEPESSEPAPSEPAPSAITPPSDTAAAVDEPAEAKADDLGDQGVGGSIGIAAGGRVTPGGLRVTGHYLYQLSSQDWFDGMASFTLGGGDASCYRDRDNSLICDHGLADGGGIEIAAGVRRIFDEKSGFRPFARLAIGVAFVRFSDDEVSGLVLPLHVGAGLRARVANGVAVVADADVAFGFGRYSDGLGLEPHLALAITAGVEFRLP